VVYLFSLEANITTSTPKGIRRTRPSPRTGECTTLRGVQDPRRLSLDLAEGYIRYFKRTSESEISHILPTSDSAASDVMSAPCVWPSAAQFNADTDTAGLSQPTSSVLILSSEDQSRLFLSFHGQLDMTQSVGSSHAARDPYFCTTITHGLRNLWDWVVTCLANYRSGSLRMINTNRPTAGGLWPRFSSLMADYLYYAKSRQVVIVLVDF